MLNSKVKLGSNRELLSNNSWLSMRENKRGIKKLIKDLYLENIKYLRTLSYVLSENCIHFHYWVV